MKREIYSVLSACLATTAALAQNPTGLRASTNSATPTASQIIRDRGPHWQTVQDVIPYQDVQGNWLYQTNTYVHLEPGLNYRTTDGSWTNTVPEFDLSTQGAVASRGQHQFTLPANLNGSQPVTLVLPDGKTVTSRPHGLAYFDASTGQAVLIAQLKDCQGFQIATNQILYPDAFTDILADVRYTYSASGVEQDIVLRQAPSVPETFGLNSATTRLEVWSEFLQTPVPKQDNWLLNPNEVAAGGPALVDSELNFGAMRMGPGRAFEARSESIDSIPVAKTWNTVQGRSFLIEAVEVPAVQPDLQTLPQVPGGGALRRKPAKREVVLQQLPVAPEGKNRERAEIRPASKKLLAALAGPALVLDYSILNAGTLGANYVFKGDTTYYINGAVSTTQSTTAATTFEGGAVFKYNSGVSAKLTVTTPINWQGSLYRPVVFTSKNDNSVGELITGSTGTPSTGDHTAIYLDGSAATGANTSFSLSNLRISYAQTAISVNQQAAHSFRHLQLVSCGTGITATSATFYVGNALFYSMGTGLTGTSSSATVEQATIDSTTTFCGSGLGTSGPTVRNSILYGVTTPGTFVNSASTVVMASTNPFQTVQGGLHYLAGGSPYRNFGTTAIDTSLAADLTKLTTYPPVTLATAISTPTTLSPQAQRDSDTPDLGFHYAPLDYIASNLGINSGVTLTLTNGVAVGFYGTLGLNISGTVVSQGLPNQLNRLTILSTVQEVLSGIITSTSNFTLLAGTANATLRFSDVSFLAAARAGRALHPSTFNSTITIRDSQLRGVYSYAYNYLNSGFFSTQIVFRNNVAQGCTLDWEEGQYGASQPYYLTLTVQNSLFSGCTLTLVRSTSYYGTWTITDNLFDGTAPVINYFTSYNPIDVVGYNGYIGTASNPLGGSGNQVSLTRDFVTGPLGSYYRPTSGSAGSLAGLNDADSTTSRTPAALGLYHFTSRSDLAKEASTPLDIGSHYIATDSNGYPLDYDGDGIPDYLEDSNGNGVLSSAETDWQVSNGVGAGANTLLLFTPLQQ